MDNSIGTGRLGLSLQQRPWQLCPTPPGQVCSCHLLPAGSVTPLSSQVRSEERAVRDHGHTDGLQLPAGLLQELRDVFCAVFHCRHGPDLQLCGCVCPGYGHQFGAEHLILCLTSSSPPTSGRQPCCPQGEWPLATPTTAFGRTQFVGRDTEPTRYQPWALRHSSLTAASQLCPGL